MDALAMAGPQAMALANPRIQPTEDKLVQSGERLGRRG